MQHTGLSVTIDTFLQTFMGSKHPRNKREYYTHAHTPKETTLKGEEKGGSWKGHPIKKSDFNIHIWLSLILCSRLQAPSSVWRKPPLSPSLPQTVGVCSTGRSPRRVGFSTVDSSPFSTTDSTRLINTPPSINPSTLHQRFQYVCLCVSPCSVLSLSDGHLHTRHDICEHGDNYGIKIIVCLR